MPVVMQNVAVKLVDLSPLVRNTNTGGDPRQLKAGPQDIVRLADGDYRMIFEAIEDTSPGFDDRTLAMRALASALQGPWTVNPATVLNDGSAGWKNSEAAPTKLIRDGNRWAIYFHGGNNTGPRKIGVMYSTDGLALATSFVDDPASPILSNGGAGSWEEKAVADAKIRRLRDGSLLGFYRGIDAAGVSRCGRLTGTSLTSLTKYAGNPVLGTGTGWRSGGTFAGDFIEDPEGRIHLFIAGFNGTADQVGYFYSDDYGITWTQGANNPIIPLGASGSYDFQNAGDVVNVVDDGDVLFITYGGANLTNYPTNPPLHGIAAALTPYRKSAPTRIGKFFLPNSYGTVPGGKTSVVNQTQFVVCGRFRIFRTTRANYMEVWGDEAAFNIHFFLQKVGGAGANAGKLLAEFRTPAAQVQLVSTAVVDDAAWHKFAVIRRGATGFELWIDGVKNAENLGSTPGTNASATAKALGNWNPSLGIGDEPFRGTISDYVQIHGWGATATWAEIDAIIDARTFPGGVSAHINLPAEMTDNGDVATVEATPLPPLSLVGSRRRMRGLLRLGV